jgi:YjbE family integral membrane protein
MMAHSDFISALVSIILIDLVLAGDNALVIGLAARNVPKERQRAVIIWGTVGAIAVRALLTGAVVWLLRIPGFLLAGGLALVWIGWKLASPQVEHEAAVVAKTSFVAAVRTIIIADAVMGVDNVLAVGGAAQGSYLLVLVGLAISIPIVVWGSALVLRLVDRHPSIIWLGAGVIGWTAAKMIAAEPMLAGVFEAHGWLKLPLYVLIIGALGGIPAWRAMSAPMRARVAAVALMLAWVTGFGWLEQRLGGSVPSFSDAGWDDDWLDLVRWTGWIPLVAGVDWLLTRRTRTLPS